MSLNCDLELTVQTNSAGTSGIATGFALTGGLCPLLSFPGFFILDSITASDLDIKDLALSAPVPPTSCGPTDARVIWSGGNQEITFDSVVLGSGTCAVLDGFVTRSTGPALTIAP